MTQSTPTQSPPAKDVESQVASTMQLVLDYQGGNQEAFGELYQRYYPQVLKIVRIRMGAKLRRKMDSCDVAQDTFGAALRDLPRVRLQGRGALINWLAQVAENVIRGHIDWFATKKRDVNLEVEMERLRNDVQSGVFSIEPQDREASVLSRMSKREDIQHLIECLAEMPEDQREVIVQYRIAGCSLDVTAENLGRTKHATSQLRYRAEARLASLMSRRQPN